MAAPGRSVGVGAGAEGVAVDPVSRLVAVAVRDPATLVLLGADDLRVRRRIPLPGAARHVTLAGPGGPFLVPAGGGLVTVAVPGGETESVATGPAPHDAVAAGGRFLVVDRRAGTLSAVEAGRVRARVRVAREPEAIVALDRGRRVAVLSGPRAGPRRPRRRRRCGAWPGPRRAAGRPTSSPTAAAASTSPTPPATRCSSSSRSGATSR